MQPPTFGGDYRRSSTARTLRHRAAFTSPRNPAQSLPNPTSPQDIHKENQCFIPRNLSGRRHIPLRDSPLPGQPFLTAPDRETPDGRNGLRAAAGGKAGCKPGSEPRKRTDERERDGSRTWRTSGERVGAAAEGSSGCRGNRGSQGPLDGKARKRVDPSGRRQGGRKTRARTASEHLAPFLIQRPRKRNGTRRRWGSRSRQGYFSASVAPVTDP